MELLATKQTEHGCPLLKFEPAMNAYKQSFLASCKDGQKVKIKLTRLRPRKTYQQTKTIWGLLIATIKNALDERGIDLGALIPGRGIPDGVPIPREVIMSLLYAACNDVGDNGERKTLSKMDVAEAARFFERCRDEAQRMFGVIVPDPDPNWREKIADAR